MATLLRNKTKFLSLIFLAIFLSAYSAPSPRPGAIKKEYKHAYKVLKGVCYNQKSKEYKKSSQYTSYHKKLHHR